MLLSFVWPGLSRNPATASYRILIALTTAKTRRFDGKTLQIDSIDGSSNEHSGCSDNP
jgi:hypothetical protein